MGPSVRLLRVLFVVLLTMCAAAIAQNAKLDGAKPKSLKKSPVNVRTIMPFSASTVLNVRSGTSPTASTLQVRGPVANVSTSTGPGGTLFGIQTLPTFSGAFAPEAGASQGFIFPFLMMGNDPLAGGTTIIPTKITEVSLALLNPDGTANMTVPFTNAFTQNMVNSPNFVNFSYDSSLTLTQFADAVQRAEFFNVAKPSWHTRLGFPTIVNKVTIGIPAYVNVTFADGTTEAVRAYYTGTAGDGSTFVLLLDLLFNANYDNLVVDDIISGNFTTGAVNMDLFPNTFLFSANEASPNTPGSCCVLGFHTYFYEPGVAPQPQWVTLFSSFISPGLFGGGFQDVTALSHEISEAFNDPFLNNATPVWQFPNQPANSTACQGNLETGDPIEVLANAVYPITLTKGTVTRTYHPQTEALLQWFEMGAGSNAIDGAFSYPDETALTASAVPCP